VHVIITGTLIAVYRAISSIDGPRRDGLFGLIIHEDATRGQRSPTSWALFSLSRRARAVIAERSVIVNLLAGRLRRALTRARRAVLRAYVAPFYERAAEIEIRVAS